MCGSVGYVYMHVRAHWYLCVSCMCIMTLYTRVRIHACVSTPVHLHVLMHAYMSVYIYIYTHIYREREKDVRMLSNSNICTCILLT